MIPKNIQAAINLVKQYESLTIEELQKADALLKANKIIKSCFPWGTLQTVTGFGNGDLCKLCLVSCKECVYTVFTGNLCERGENSQTHRAIKSAKTLEQLLKAVKNREAYLRQLLTKNGIAIV